jgi:hypothetical protein
LHTTDFAYAETLLSKALKRVRASGLYRGYLTSSRLVTRDLRVKMGYYPVVSGGLGDVYKGLVKGQSVSVEVMHIFQDSDIKAALKVCSQFDGGSKFMFHIY